MTFDGESRANKKTIKFHGDSVANVVMDLRSQGSADSAAIETFDAALDPLVCDTINIQVVADFVTITYYKDEQAGSIIRRELIPSHRIEKIVVADSMA